MSDLSEKESSINFAKALQRQTDYILYQAGLYELKRLAELDPEKYNELYQQELSKSFPNIYGD